MSIAYNSTLKSNRMQDVCDAIDSKTRAAWTGAAAAGSLVIGTSALSGATGVLVTFTLPVPSFSESGGTITLQGVPFAATASAAGTAAKAEIRNNAGTVIVGGLTVGTSGADVIIDNTSITAGLAVNCTGGTITHA